MEARPRDEPNNSPKRLASGVTAKDVGQEPRRVRSYAVSLGASLGTGLAYDFFRFLNAAP
ncbi:hypothetical protein SAMN05216339_1215 [Nitrosomonas eutropha]|uniref:Uncharacterized protein n=1 Tax=Nitrosomonas eutropha TaxID=916 RepID=A0A1I7JCM3_9PROT|nr:hypothetical protein SAMN05216339_1215 [Nitrosomonas eutropha]